MIGDWAGLSNHVKLGGLMQKGLALRAGMCPMQARRGGAERDEASGAGGRAKQRCLTHLPPALSSFFSCIGRSCCT